MDAEVNNVIYMELNSGPKIANSTCGKAIDVETIDRDSTVYRIYKLPLGNNNIHNITIKLYLNVLLSQTKDLCKKKNLWLVVFQHEL